MTIRKRNKINAVKTSKNLTAQQKEAARIPGSLFSKYKRMYLKRFLLQRFAICIQFDDLISQFL
jgi:hypothetical protein